MFEMEMKFAVADFAPIRARLDAWQARADEPIAEADQYFNAPDRDFAKTDEVFRLRRIGTANHLTYKGPKNPGKVKTRAEIEIAFAEGDQAAADMSRMLTSLGYRPVAVVQKRRHIYHHERQGFAMQICLDELAELGYFVEVEIIAPLERREEAEKALLHAAAELGLEKLERRSYLGMILEKRAAT
jgi:adenylate cyclase, class 2